MDNLKSTRFETFWDKEAGFWVCKATWDDNGVPMGTNHIAHSPSEAFKKVLDLVSKYWKEQIDAQLSTTT